MTKINKLNVISLVENLTRIVVKIYDQICHRNLYCLYLAPNFSVFNGLPIFLYPRLSLYF